MLGVAARDGAAGVASRCGRTNSRCHIVRAPQLWQNLGSAIGFFYAVSVELHVQTAIVLAILLLSSCLFARCAATDSAASQRGTARSSAEQSSMKYTDAS